MDIVEAVENIRAYREEVIENLDVASSLREIALVRARRQKALNEHDRLMDKIVSGSGVSRIYGGSQTVQRSRDYTRIQDMIAEMSDLGKEVQEDGRFLDVALELVGDIVDAIPDVDTKLVIKHKYIDGWTDTEIEELFSESLPGHAQRLEQKYFRSLR